MFFKLSMYELKYQLRNITLYVILAMAMMFVINQTVSEVGGMSTYPKAPKPSQQVQNSINGMTPYGYKKVNDPQKIMKAVYFEQLDRAVKSGEVMKDFFIINKEEKLDAKQIGFIKDAMKRIAPDGEDAGGHVDISVSYDEFWSILNNLDRQLGGRTWFARKRVENTLMEPKTYEEALKDFNDLTVKDMYTRAVARLGADYSGIVFGILPVFLGAFVFIRDKKSKAEELIFSRGVSGLTYVGAKYAGLCLTLLLSVLVIALYFTFLAVSLRLGGFNVDVFAFLRTFLFWLTPTIMGVCALSMLVSLLFKSFIPAFITGIICWVASIAPMEGSYSLYKLFIRHNTLSPLSSAANNAIAINRLFIAGASLMVLAAAAIIWDKRRPYAGENMD